MPPASKTASDAAEGVPAPASAATAAQEITLRFTRTYRGWNRGVEAGFTPGFAADLVGHGVAVQIHPAIQRQPAMAGMVRK